MSRSSPCQIGQDALAPGGVAVPCGYIWRYTLWWSAALCLRGTELLDKMSGSRSATWGGCGSAAGLYMAIYAVMPRCRTGRLFTGRVSAFHGAAMSPPSTLDAAPLLDPRSERAIP